MALIVLLICIFLMNKVEHLFLRLKLNNKKPTPSAPFPAQANQDSGPGRRHHTGCGAWPGRRRGLRTPWSPFPPGPRSPAPSPPPIGLGGAGGPVGGAAPPDLSASGRRRASPRVPAEPRAGPSTACPAPACWPRSAARSWAPRASSPPRVSAPPAPAPAPSSPRALDVRRAPPSTSAVYKLGRSAGAVQRGDLPDPGRGCARPPLLSPRLGLLAGPTGWSVWAATRNTGDSPAAPQEWGLRITKESAVSGLSLPICKMRPLKCVPRARLPPRSFWDSCIDEGSAANFVWQVPPQPWRPVGSLEFCAPACRCSGS